MLPRDGIGDGLQAFGELGRTVRIGVLVLRGGVIHERAAASHQLGFRLRTFGLPGGSLRFQLLPQALEFQGLLLLPALGGGFESLTIRSERALRRFDPFAFALPMLLFKRELFSRFGQAG